MTTGAPVVLARLLPGTARCSERHGDSEDAAAPSAERALVAGATAERRREFTTVRLCGREALRALGHPPVALLPGPSREPRWPPSIVGSMTHCTGYRAAVVAWSRDLAAVGIDAEEHEPLPEKAVGLVVRPEERVRLRQLEDAHPGVHWSRLLFSAKESVFKAWFPLTGRWLGFDDATVMFEPNGGTFTAELLIPGPVVSSRRLDGFTGRWLATGRLLLTAVAVGR